MLATHMSHSHLTSQRISTALLCPWFAAQGIEVTHIQDLQVAAHHNFSQNSPIVLLENTRSYDGEQGGDVSKFTRQLRSLGSLYVNEAFATLHRSDSSLTKLPHAYQPSQRALGIHCYTECATLHPIREKPNHPFVLIIGGKKFNAKTAALQRFINKPRTTRPTSVLIGGALAPVFLTIQGYSAGATYITPDMVARAHKINRNAKAQGIPLLLPQDVVVQTSASKRSTRISTVDAIGSQEIIIDIGPQTCHLFSEQIQGAETIVWSGTMGKYEEKEGSNGTSTLMHIIAEARGYTVIGGGDTTYAAIRANVEKRIDHLSPGGSALLSFLSCQDLETLPALQAIVSSL